MGGHHTSTTDPKLNGISLQSSTLGLPLTMGWGRNRAKTNLIWYNAFTAIPHTTSQSGGKGLGGGSSNTSYTYTASVIMAIGEGPVAGIRTIYRDKQVFTSLAAAGLSLATGTPTQPVWSYLTSLYPAQARAYARIAYIYAADYALNDDASLPNHSFETDWPIQLAGLADADPKDILTDFLTNTQCGLPGWPAGLIGDLSDWSLYCRANNLILSPLLEAQVTASDFVTEITDATNSAPFWSEGQLKVRTYGDRAATANGVTWTPDLTPLYDLTEDDFIGDPPVKVEILDQSDAYNVVQVEFFDRTNQYNVAIQPAFDDANIDLYGVRKQDPTTWHSICDADVARASAQLLLQRTLYKRLRYTFSLPWNFALLEPMDYVTLTTTTDELQIDRQLVRIIQIDEGADDVLQIIAEHVDVGTGAAALYASHSGSGFQPNTAVAPGSISTPILFQAASSLTGLDPEVWCAVASTSPTWGGCEVWVSIDNVAYARAGRITGPARYGYLTAALASHADPDTTNTLAVDLSTSLGALVGGTTAEADALATLALVGDELVAFRDAALTSAYHYALSTLHRGAYGSAPAAHAIGDPFVRIDDAIFKLGFAANNIGSTIHVKFPSFNIFGQAMEDISAVTAYTLTLAASTDWRIIAATPTDWEAVTSRPTELTDGRVGTALDSSGVVANNKVVAGSILPGTVTSSARVVPAGTFIGTGDWIEIASVTVPLDQAAEAEISANMQQAYDPDDAKSWGLRLKVNGTVVKIFAYQFRSALTDILTIIAAGESLSATTNTVSVEWAGEDSDVSVLAVDLSVVWRFA